MRERADGCAFILGLVAAMIAVTAFAIAVPQRGRWYEEIVGAAVLGGASVLFTAMFAGLFRLVGLSKPATPDNQVAGVVRELVGALERADRRRLAPSLGPRRKRFEAFLAAHPDHPWSPEIRRLLDEVDRRVRDDPRPSHGTPGRSLREAVEDGLRNLRYYSDEHPFTTLAAGALVLGTIALLLWVAVVLPLLAQVS